MRTLSPDDAPRVSAQKSGSKTFNKIKSPDAAEVGDQLLWSDSDHLRESESHQTELGSCESSSVGSLICKTQ